uniref:FAR1 DNA binding domain-containing protein n=1 Tax=Tanacetum cinerariifolium TaxID=118510 RepID=A0A699ID94_TANCI|nr:FAR1 DNA binding domain-containing protein [Tanacetum cinerariifolium]
MASMNTRLNIEKLDGNIVPKHGGSKQVGLKQLGSKQVGFKQLGLGVEIGFHEVQDEKRVWFEVELQGAQRDRKAEVFQVSNDDTVVAQRRLEDKQPEEKTNTDCLVKEQENKHLVKRVQRFEVPALDEDVEYRLCLNVTLKCMRTPRATLNEQTETPGGLIYWEPHVEGIPIPVEGAYYDTIDEALDIYTKYAKMA